jgi:DnaJ-class molecular chaperone
LTHGDPIKLVCEFKVATPEERAAKKRELEEQLESVNNLETGLEESDSETEEVPSMPDLDALSEELKD